MTQDVSAFGWWPGDYSHRHCSDCDADFMGGKRASRCEQCANAAMQRWQAAHGPEVLAKALDAQHRPTQTALERISAKVAARTDLHDRDSAGAIGINMGDLRALLEEIGQ